MPALDWHARFSQQARWTHDLRTYLFEQTGLWEARRILEVGCGTGAILESLAHCTAGLHGLDIARSHLLQAEIYAPQALLANGDARQLPYASQVFDITLCHFLLMWVKAPVQLLCEMQRVTRPGGHVLALAEPDYNARIDLPPELAVLGALQTDSLERQGADPFIGSRLGELFEQAGIRLVESGPLARTGTGPASPDELDLEWAVLESDLAGLLPSEDLAAYKQLERKACEDKTRVLHVPTWYAWGIA
ncbi:MAG: methyltransferase domain-containing protein [Anaerolineales bacterium]|nr:methyltransferase domain-containing protein [Anaerolineales bacterium]